MHITLDFETASACDLTKSGAYRYWEDPTTEILCLCWKTSGGQRGRWAPGDPGDDLRALAADPTIHFIAHNASFEINGWRQQMVPLYGFPEVSLTRWEDTMAVCASKALPLKLDHVAKVLGLATQKDMAGSKLTTSLSKPAPKGKLKGSYDRSPETLARVIEYCETDVEAEDELDLKIGKLSRNERSVWLLDQTINARGVRLDVPYVKQSQKIVDLASGPMMAEFHTLTGIDKIGQVAQIKGWVTSRGAPLPNLQKATIAAVLGHEEIIDDDDAEDDLFTQEVEPWLKHLELPPDVRRALEIRSVIGSASVKKLRAMLLCVCMDHRARGLLQYHAAGPGRWGGRLIQPQNFPRGLIRLEQGTKIEHAPDPQMMVQAIMTGDPEYVRAVLGDPIEVVLSGLRHALVSGSGHLFAVGDFAGIEARVVLALAGQLDKVALIAGGTSPYCDLASIIYKREITKTNLEEYQIGKFAFLGCGFGMGWQKFQARYAPGQPDEFCQEVIRTYRKDWAPAVPKLWYGLEAAAVKAVWEGGQHEAFGVTYWLQDGWLVCRRPSGARMWYRNPCPTLTTKPWAPEEKQRAWTYQAKKSGQWRTIQAYGGLLTENVVQGLARDLLVSAMFRCEANGMPIVLTVHDEIVAEPEAALADAKALGQLMAERPKWAEALQIPVVADCWVDDRYRK